MLKQIVKCIRERLLKIDWIKLEVEAYKLVQAKKRHHEDWAKLMHSGKTFHTNDSNKTILVDYVDTRMVGQRPVTPTIIRPFGMGRRKR